MADRDRRDHDLPLPGLTAAKPGSAMTPLPGISAKVVDEEGKELVPGADEAEHVTGYLVLDQPWPSMLRGIWGDAERYKETYWSRYAEVGISPATGRASTPTATSGCSAASTT